MSLDLFKKRAISVDYTESMKLIISIVRRERDLIFDIALSLSSVCSGKISNTALLLLCHPCYEYEERNHLL